MQKIMVQEKQQFAMIGQYTFLTSYWDSKATVLDVPCILARLWRVTLQRKQRSESISQPLIGYYTFFDPLSLSDYVQERLDWYCLAYEV